MCCVNVNSNNTQFIALYICINAIIHLFAYTIRYFCRSVEFDDQTKQCILSEEDSISQKDDISVSSSPTHHFYDLVCLDNRKSCTIQFQFSSATWRARVSAFAIHQCHSVWCWCWRAHMFLFHVLFALFFCVESF